MSLRYIGVIKSSTKLTGGAYVEPFYYVSGYDSPNDLKSLYDVVEDRVLDSFYKNGKQQEIHNLDAPFATKIILEWIERYKLHIDEMYRFMAITGLDMHLNQDQLNRIIAHTKKTSGEARDEMGDE